MLDTIIVAAIISGSISVIGILTSKIIEQRQKKINIMYEKREIAYAEFIDLIRSTLVNFRTDS